MTMLRESVRRLEIRSAVQDGAIVDRGPNGRCHGDFENGRPDSCVG